jgi:hypothetical protein
MGFGLPMLALLVGHLPQIDLEFYCNGNDR